MLLFFYMNAYRPCVFTHKYIIACNAFFPVLVTNNEKMKQIFFLFIILHDKFNELLESCSTKQ